jgi:hypothetical protein
MSATSLKPLVTETPATPADKAAIDNAKNSGDLLTEFKNLVADTLSDSQIKARGYFDPAAVRALLTRMESREFLYLKQVMSLVILELWHRAFIDGKGPDA